MVAKKNGHKEEEHYWSKLLWKGNGLIDIIEEKHAKVMKLVEEMEVIYGLSPKTSSLSRRKKTTERRSIKRLREKSHKTASHSVIDGFLVKKRKDVLPKVVIPCRMYKYM